MTIATGDLRAARAAALSRARAILSRYPAGQELARAMADVDTLLRAVADERVAALPPEYRPAPNILDAIARGYMYDLGPSWDEHRYASATKAEKTAHRAIQDYWHLIRIADADQEGETRATDEATDQSRPTHEPTDVEHVKCALASRYEVPEGEPGGPKVDRRAWCGRAVPRHEWCFTDATHALLNRANGRRLLLCPACADAIRKTVDVAEHGR